MTELSDVHWPGRETPGVPYRSFRREEGPGRRGRPMSHEDRRSRPGLPEFRHDRRPGKGHLRRCRRSSPTVPAPTTGLSPTPSSLPDDSGLGARVGCASLTMPRRQAPGGDPEGSLSPWDGPGHVHRFAFRPSGPGRLSRLSRRRSPGKEPSVTTHLGPVRSIRGSPVTEGSVPRTGVGRESRGHCYSLNRRSPDHDEPRGDSPTDLCGVVPGIRV